MKLDAAIAALPVGHLQLEGHARKATAGLANIGELVRMFSRQVRTYKRISKTGNHIESVLRILVEGTSEQGFSGWDTFRKLRPLLVDSQQIFFASPAFKGLTKDVRQGSLAKLHLNRRAINALEAVKVKTIGELVPAARRGIVDLPASGDLTAREVVEALQALANSVTPDGSVDWLAFARTRNFLVLPHKERAGHSSREFVRLLPSVCELAVGSKFGEAGLLVLRTRLLRNPKSSLSLRDVANQLGQTKERVRLMQLAIVKALSHAIWKEEYRGCRFRFRSTFLDPFHSLAAALGGIPARAIPRAEWLRILSLSWGVTERDLRHVQALIIELCGLEILPNVAESLARVTTRIERVLKNNGSWMSTETLWQTLRPRVGARTPQPSALPAVLASMSNVEGDGSGGYRLRFEGLRYIDCYERILKERGTPMHYREIAAAMHRHSKSGARKIDPRLVAKGMGRCPRFSCVGRTGLWALSAWIHVEKGTVADVAADLLSKSRTPLSEVILFTGISPRRPVKRNSIGILLRADPRFIRVAPSLWALSTVQKAAGVPRKLS